MPYFYTQIQLSSTQNNRWKVPLYLPRYSDTLSTTILCSDRLLQFVQSSGLFEFLHQTFHGFLSPFVLRLRRLSLSPPQQSLDNRRRKWREGHGKCRLQVPRDPTEDRITCEEVVITEYKV